MPDLPDWYSMVTELEAEAYKFRGGADASKSAAPETRDVYFATDTKILYICVVDGSWTGFDASILVQGVLTLYENMAGGGKRITNIADPTAAQDAATRAYVLATKALLLLLTGGTMSGDIAMGGNKVTGLGAPVAANDAVRKAYADLFILKTLLSTLGDIIRRGAAAPERLGIGSAGQVLTVVAGEPAWATPTAAATLTVAETEVFDGTSPTSWTDLELGGTVGANAALVLLKVSYPVTKAAAFRKDGDTDEFYGDGTEDEDAKGCVLFQGGTVTHNVVIVATSDAGKVEWITEEAKANTTIDIIAYIK